MKGNNNGHRKTHRERKREQRDRLSHDEIMAQVDLAQRVVAPRKRTLNAQTEAQGHYILSMESSTLTFGVGPAGTGKTFVAAVYACNQLIDRKIAKLIVTRPSITAGESSGYLPGELEEKFAPFFAPFRGVFDQTLGVSQTDAMIKSGRIEAKPIEYLRGLTFDDAIVILDEAQNVTPHQMKLFLTRIGKNCTVIINGDITQKDIPGPDGLSDAIRRLETLEGVQVVHFTEDDIVRSGIVKAILQRYAKT